MGGQISRGQKRGPVNLTAPESLFVFPGKRMGLGLHHLRFYHFNFVTHRLGYFGSGFFGGMKFGSFCDLVNVDHLSGASDGSP
jgi:hypothetical protein